MADKVLRRYSEGSQGIENPPSTDNAPDFVHTVLPETHIRLLKYEPAESTATLSLTLTIHPKANLPAYNALSYR